MIYFCLMRKVFSVLVILLLLFSSLYLISCSRHQEAASSLHYGLTLAPSGIDPHLNASNELGIPLSSVYDTLVFLNPENGEFVPGLAKRWTISDDGSRIFLFDRYSLILYLLPGY